MSAKPEHFLDRITELDDRTRYTFGSSSKVYVKGSRDDILVPMREIIQATHNIAEGAGVLAYAALKKHREQWQGKRIACVLTGGNASMAMIARALAV